MGQILHLAYHYLTLPGEEPAGPRCELVKFQNQLQSLKDNGFEVLSCHDFLVKLHLDLPLPEKCATLSFDDNLRDGYTRAYPLLQKYGFPGTFFVMTTTLNGRIPPVIKIQMLAGKIGGKELQRVLKSKLVGSAYESLMDPEQYNMVGKKMGEPNPDNRRVYWVFCHILPMSLQVDLANEMFDEAFGVGVEKELHQKMFIQPDELVKMSRNNMDIASHTVNHPLLSTCGVSDVGQEVIQSLKALRELRGLRVCEIFGWPFGGVFKPNIVKVVVDHFYGAFNYLNGDNNDPYNIPRVDGATVSL